MSNKNHWRWSAKVRCQLTAYCRIETAMQRCLLTAAGRRTLYVEHDLDGLLRGDVQTRFTAYRIAREIGVYSANDIRQKEAQPPIPVATATTSRPTGFH